MAANLVPSNGGAVNSLPWKMILGLAADPLLANRPDAASELALHLKQLAPWLLSRDVLDAAIRDDSISPARREKWRQRPVLPTQQGGCWIPAVVDGSKNDLPALRRVVLIPLQWTNDPAASRRLPKALTNLGTEVLSRCRRAFRLLRDEYSLGLIPEWRDLDLSDCPIELKMASGWLPVAGGLLTMLGGKPEPKVWATGTFNEQTGSIAPVNGLEGKLELAVEHQAATMFVPSSNVPDCREIVARRRWSLDIEAIKENETNLAEALKSYRQRLATPPTFSDTREERRSYYLAETDYNRRLGFYRDAIMPDLIQELRKQWLTKHRDPIKVLVTIVSKSPELVALMMGVIQPERCLAYHTKLNENDTPLTLLRDVLDDATWQRIEFIACSSPIELIRQLENTAAAKLSAYAPDACVVDLTPGTKEMSLALALYTAPAGSHRCYIRSQTNHEPQFPIPFTQELVVLKQPNFR